MGEQKMASYKNKSFCKHCGEWKKKGIICLDCGQKLRNNRRFKYETKIRNKK